LGGFFAVASEEDCVADLFFGTDYHCHLGTVRGGLAVRLQGNLGIGVISDFDDQPLIISSHLGRYALVTVGRIDNMDELSVEVFRSREAHFSEMSDDGVSPTELVATLINRGDTFTDGIRHAQEAIEGSCSLLLLTEDCVYAARDRLGRTPVTLGRKYGAYAATMETCALPNLGFEVDRYLGPGEVVRITPEGAECVVPPGDRLQVCAFLWVYYGYPASHYEGINVEVVRYRCGEALAKADDCDVDMVAGIPDSGTGHAIGYANAARVPYSRPFVKYTPTWPRSFMPQDQRVRDLVARMKLIPIYELIQGMRLLFCEDSIVRGTQLKDTIQRLFDSGAREVHMRPACPPLIHGCKFLNFSRSKSVFDLAGRRAIKELGNGNDYLDEYADASSERYAAMVERVQHRLGLTSLRYQQLPDLIHAIGLPREKVCTYCWNGAEPFATCPSDCASSDKEAPPAKTD